MKTDRPSTDALREIDVPRTYSSSILRIARHFLAVDAATPVLALADELLRLPGIAVVGAVDRRGRAIGLVRRDRLLALVGKPYGRDVLARSSAAEAAEAARAFDYRANVFSVAQELRRAEPLPDPDAFFALRDSSGEYRGAFSAADLASHLAGITEEDIELAGSVQERMLESNDVADDGQREIEAWSKSAKGVGGDFYFVRSLGGGRTFAALCDVSGKGVSASLVVSLVWGLLSAFDYSRGLRALVLALNASLVATFRMERFMTGFFMVYDSGPRSVTFADMGHSHVGILRGGRVLPLGTERRNYPVGIDPSMTPAVHRAILGPRDAVFAYSDGIVEQENEAGEEFGEARLRGALASAGAAERGAGAALADAVDAFRGGAPQQDDMSFLLFRAL